jgi:hypothetical protein
VSARNLAPPGQPTGPGGEPEAGEVERLGGSKTTTIVPYPINDGSHLAVESYLRDLIAVCDDPPLIDKLIADDLGTPCGTAAIARAALCWLREKRPDVLEARLRQELAEADWLVAYRVRQVSHDVRGTTDWSRVLDVVQARREVAA